MSESVELERPPDVEAPAVGVRRGVLETLVARAGVLPLSFGIGVVTSRFLLPVGRGAFVLGLLAVTLAAALLGNVGTALVHEVGRDVRSAHALYGRAIALTAVLGVVGALALVPIDLALAQEDYRVVTYAVVGLTPLLLAQTVGSMLLALGRLRLWNALQLVLPAVTLAGMLVLVVGFSKGVTGAIAAWVGGQLGTAAVGLYATRHLWWPPPRDLFDLRRTYPMLVLGLRIGAVNLLSLVNYRIELIILESYRGLNSVGIYSLSTSLGELLWLASSAVSTAIVARAIHSDDSRAVGVVTRSVRQVLLGTAVLAVALGVVSPWLIPAVFGPRFGPSVDPLLALLPGIVAFAPGTVLAVFFSMRLGRIRYAFWLALTSTVATAIVAVVLIPSHGAMGAAIASTVGYVTSISVGLVWFAHIARVPLSALVPRPEDVLVHVRFARGLVGRR